MFHHQKTAAIQKTTVVTRDPPNSSLPFKLNNHPNRALEISTNISTQSQSSITYTRTYQVGLSSQSSPEKAPQSQATRETFLGVVCHSQSVLAESFIHLKQQIHPPTCICIRTLCLPSWYCPDSLLKPTSPLCTRMHLLSPTQGHHTSKSPFSFLRYNCSLSLPPSFIIPINIQTCCNFSDLYKTNTTTLLILHPHPATNKFLCSLLKKMFRRVVYIHGLQFSIFMDLLQQAFSSTIPPDVLLPKSPVTITFQVQCQFSVVLCQTHHSIWHRQITPPLCEMIFAWLVQHLALLGFLLPCCSQSLEPVLPYFLPQGSVFRTLFYHNHALGYIILSHGYKYHSYTNNSYSYVLPRPLSSIPNSYIYLPITSFHQNV